ncbi:CHAPERONE DNAJ-DOMAIN SUPERFAMILY PROTEIN-RELATED [Salix purpurea]|uniref:CHAPERONE DNAJ-DOMAIN SUPERFAMILY PROTEIN-RELATED n=1 Tax=Salix purpurea TaxID=77065 RepID=A0A9Q0V937_SALPP|nr:CHAPERONE DNAJ-DOMAIN SUPERFAMILY PROTEIN-RELATED [Salix purpurea]
MQHLEADGIHGLTSLAKENHLDLSGESLQSGRTKDTGNGMLIEKQSLTMHRILWDHILTEQSLQIFPHYTIDDHFYLDHACSFRLSALKWHPDKHQGASQAAAGERFKLCVDAYKSLCDALA